MASANPLSNAEISPPTADDPETQELLRRLEEFKQGRAKLVPWDHAKHEWLDLE